MRSAIAVTIAAVACAGRGERRRARGSRWSCCPQGTSVDEVAGGRDVSGADERRAGSVPAEQTYLDISQGNRVFDSLYDPAALPPATVPLNRAVTDAAVLRRAESAPAEIEPGLLALTLARAGRGFAVRDATVGQLSRLVGRLGGNDLLIAIERPPPARNRAAGDRDRRPRLRRQPHLRHDPHRRLRALHRRRPDDPRTLRRSRSPSAMSGQPIRAEGCGRPGRDRLPRRADGGDLRPSRPGDRPQPAGLGGRARPGGGRQPRRARPRRGPGRRPGGRLPAAAAAVRARRSNRARRWKC